MLVFTLLHISFMITLTVTQSDVINTRPAISAVSAAKSVDSVSLPPTARSRQV